MASNGLSDHAPKSVAEASPSDVRKTDKAPTVDEAWNMLAEAVVLDVVRADSDTLNAQEAKDRAALQMFRRTDNALHRAMFRLLESGDLVVGNGLTLGVQEDMTSYPGTEFSSSDPA